jgi:hypothetical protein
VYLALTSALALVGCTHTVKITVKNPTRYGYDVRVAVNGNWAGAGEVGRAGAEGSATRVIEVKDNDTVSLDAVYPGAARVWQTSRVVKEMDPNPLDFISEMALTGYYLKAFDADDIGTKLNHLGVAYDARPISAETAVKMLFGSILVVTVDGNKVTETHGMISPAALGLGLKTDSMAWPTDTLDLTTELLSSDAVTLGARFALFKGVAQGNKDGIQRQAVKLDGFGTMSFDLGMPSIGLEQIAALKAAVGLSFSRKFLFVNRMWVVRSGTIATSNGDLQMVDGEGADVVLTEKGAFRWPATPTETLTLNQQVYEIAGEVWELPNLLSALKEFKLPELKGGSGKLVFVTREGLGSYAPDITK